MNNFIRKNFITYGLQLTIIFIFIFVSLPMSSQAGKISTEEEVSYYTCEMHPRVKVSSQEYKSGSTTCPICNMNLTPVYKEILHYACEMHPKEKVSVQEYKSGSTTCPICNMNLTPVYKE